MTHDVAVALCALSLAAIGLWSTMGPFWALMTRMVKGAAAAGGVGMITTLGGLGGFIGPYVTGRLRDATHSFAGGLYAIRWAGTLWGGDERDGDAAEGSGVVAKKTLLRDKQKFAKRLSTAKIEG